MFGSRKIFSGKYLFSGNAIFRKGKYFQVFGCIWENIVKNIFWCLVVLLKIPWKIHFLLLAHIFSYFLRCQTNIIISFLNPETQITPRKKKFIIRLRLGSTTGEISEADWCCDRDWVRRQARSRSRTTMWFKDDWFSGKAT